MGLIKKKKKKKKKQHMSTNEGKFGNSLRVELLVSMNTYLMSSSKATLAKP